MREMMASRRVRWYSPSSTRALPHALHSQPLLLLRGLTTYCYYEMVLALAHTLLIVYRRNVCVALRS
jgi:hypothetical protein